LERGWHFTMGKAGGHMDHKMILTLSIINLIAVLLLLFFLFVAAWRADKSRAEYEKLRGGTEFGTLGDKFQQVEKSDFEKLAGGIARLEQQLKPMLDLTIKHERKLTGIQAKGALGEQIVAEKLFDLPHNWYARDVPFPNGAKVEFALRTPDKRWIPIDSQFTSTELAEKIEQTTDQSHRNSLKVQIRQEVRSYVGSAEKYVDSGSTLGFCIVAVPTSVFEVCLEMQAELISRNIVLISYNLLIPYILLIVDLFLKNTHSTEVLEIAHILNRSTSQIELIQKYINSKVRPPLDMVKLQQSQYGLHSQRLHEIYSKLNEIQSELDGARNMVNPIPNEDLGSIAKILQSSLTKVKDDLLEVIARQNGHQPNSDNK
jgi:DNA anti-recombination protein RmuC